MMLIYYILAIHEDGALHGMAFTTKELCVAYAESIGAHEGHNSDLYEDGKRIGSIRIANLNVK